MASHSKLVGSSQVISIATIRKDIQSVSEDARFTAWMTLYSSEEAEAKNEISSIISGSNPILKIYFCRFLASAHEKKAIQFIKELLSDSNEYVVESAKKAFEKNKFTNKEQLILETLNAPLDSAQYFAMEKLSLAGIHEATEILLKKIATASEEKLEKIFSAFRFITDKRIILDVLPFCDDKRPRVRFHALMALGALYIQGIRGIRNTLLNHLSDESVEIRMGILWLLKRLPHKKDIPHFLQAMYNDTDPLVRQQAVSGLANFPSKNTIQELVRFLVFEKSKMVSLKTEAVLLSIPAHKLVKGLKKALKSEDITTRNKVMLLYSNFQKSSPAYFQWLKTQLKKAKSDKDKLPMIESLGLLENQKALPLLDAGLNESPLIAYASMSAIIKIWGTNKNFPVFKYISNTKISATITQIALKHFTKICTPEMFDDNTTHCLIAYLKSPDLNTRYFATQALAILKDNSLVAHFLETLLSETDKTNYNLLKNSVIKIISDAPETIIPLIKNHLNDTKIITEILALIRDCHLSAEKILNIWPALVSPPIDLLQSNHVNEVLEITLPKLYNAQLTINDLVEKLKTDEEKIKILSLFAVFLEKYPTLKSTLPVSQIQTWLSNTQTESQTKLIQLLKHSASTQPINLLVKLICKTKSSPIREQAAQSLNQIMGGNS